MKCEPNYNVWFGDGECIELSTDIAKMKKTIERWEGKEGFERYLSWMQEAHVHYEASAAHVLRKNFSTFWAMMRPSFLLCLPALHPFESIWNRVSRYFRTERLRRAFTFGSMYMGMSPFDAPGTYSLLQYAELAEGIWLVANPRTVVYEHRLTHDKLGIPRVGFTKSWTLWFELGRGSE